MKLLCLVSILFVAFSILRVFYGLGHESLWTDELFSAYFADPQLTTFGDLLSRATEDGHPPGYYISLWAALRVVDGDFIVVSRALSAIAACLALVLIYFAPIGSVRWQARLVSIAIAVSSWVWYYYAQEARSYGIIYFMVALFAFCGLRARDLLAKGKLAIFWIAALSLCAIGMVFLHYYTILTSGAAFCILLLTCKTWPHRLFVICMGLVVLLCAVLLVTWHMPKIVIDVDDTWFEASLSFFAEHILRGFTALGSSTTIAVFALLIFVVSALFVSGRRLAFFKENLPAETFTGIGFLYGVIGLTIVFGISVSILFLPVFSFRLFLALAPVFWISLAYFLEWTFRLTSHRSSPRVLGLAVNMALVASLGIAGLHIAFFSNMRKGPWKFSAQYVASIETCASSKLAISWFEQPHISEDNPERFYGYYLEPNEEREWLRLPRDRFEDAIRSADYTNHALNVADDPEACPVLLWSMHFLEYGDLKSTVGYLREMLDANGHQGSDIDVLFLKPGSNSALILLDRETNTDPHQICSQSNPVPACSYWMNS